MTFKLAKDTYHKTIIATDCKVKSIKFGYKQMSGAGPEVEMNEFDHGRYPLNHTYVQDICTV